MPELNKANRQVCDVDIRVLKTLAPFLFLDTANTTTAGLTGDAVYARARGLRAIAFHNPLEGTMTVEAQVLPFRVYALFSDGTIESKGVQAVHKTIVATDSTIKIEEKSGTVRAGTVFVYPAGSFGDGLGKFLYSLIADVRLKQRHAYLAHSLLDVGRAQSALAAELFERGIQFFG